MTLSPLHQKSNSGLSLEIPLSPTKSALFWQAQSPQMQVEFNVMSYRGGIQSVILLPEF
jgi:hypothetical protein